MSRRHLGRQEQREMAIRQLEAPNYRLLEAINRHPSERAATIVQELGVRAGAGRLGRRFATLRALGLIEVVDEGAASGHARYKATAEGKAVIALVTSPWLCQTQATRDHIRLQLRPITGRRAA
jgi:hypothetical protein